MKFVVKSLLFVNLLLQMTSSLKSCFDHDQNIMITIILLAFSVIGLIGLVIGNRFILIIFSASMTLILIASITIYAIGKTNEDSMKPKVPYYVNMVSGQDANDRVLSKGTRANEPTDNNEHKLKTLMDRWLNKNNDQSRNNNGRFNKTRAGSRNNNSRSRSAQKKNQPNSYAPIVTTIAPLIIDELSDEPTASILEMNQSLQKISSLPKTSVLDRSLSSANKDQILIEKSRDPRLSILDDVTESKSPNKNSTNNPSRHDPGESELDGFVGEKVESEQWVAYERYLYEKYLNIISQSIDLIMHTMLASWMALLLDEDSDQCFGPKSSSGGRSGTLSSSSGQTSSAKEPPVYNYKGVRYSIRPDVDDSPAHIVVH